VSKTGLGYAEDPNLAELEIALEGEGRLGDFQKRFHEIHDEEWDERKRLATFVLDEASAVMHDLDSQAYPLVDSWTKNRPEIQVDAIFLAERAFELMRRRRPGQALIFIVDSVGQYVARHTDRLLDLQGIVEALGQAGKNWVQESKEPFQAWLVVTASSILEVVEALDDRRIELARVPDRFPIQLRVEMTPADITEITSTRVLAKTPAAEQSLRELYRDHRSQLAIYTRLHDTSHRQDLDERGFINSYPFMPYQIDLIVDIVSGLHPQPGAGGYISHSTRTVINLAQQMIISPVTKLGEELMGRLVTLDLVYDLLEENLTLERRKDISDVTARLSDDPLTLKVAKVLALLDLVRDLPRTPENIAAVLYDQVDRAPLIEKVSTSLKRLQVARLAQKTADGWKLYKAISPFIVGRPLRASEPMFGRKAALRFIAGKLAKFSSINIVGERRMGKTSLINHLMGHQDEYLIPQPDQPPLVLACLDLQAGVSSEGRFHGMALRALLDHLPASLGAEAGSFQEWRERLHARPEAGYDEFEGVLRRLRDPIGVCVRPVLIVDEFERLLDPSAQEGFPFPGFFNGLRALLTAELLAMVVFSRRSLSDYFRDPARSIGLTSPFPTYFTPFSLSPLDDAAADALLLQPSDHPLTPQEAAEAQRWAGGHPCHLQAAGQAWYEAKLTGRSQDWANRRLEELKTQNCLGTIPTSVGQLLEALKQYAPPTGIRRLLPGTQQRERTEMRQAIAEALGKIGDPRAVEPLIAQLKDREPGPRLAAVRALGQIGDDRAVDALKNVLEHPDAEVRNAAKLDLERIVQPEPTGEEVPISDETLQEQIRPTVGIIAALPKEYAAVKVMLENQREYTVPGRGAGRRYLLGEIPAADGSKHSLVLSLAHMGDNIAATTTSLLLEHFPTVNVIIMVGLASGIPFPERPDEHVRLGDVVVSDRRGIIQYDFDKEEIIETIHPHSHRLPNTALLEGVKFLREVGSEGSHTWQALIDQATDELGITRPPQETDTLASSTFPVRVIPHPEDPKRAEGRPRIHIGPIASANMLLKDPVKRDELRDRFSVKAVEMEGSGVVDATWHHEVGYLVVRGICDYCRHSKGDDWQQYAAIVAAAFTRALLESIHPEQLYSDYVPAYSWYISVDMSTVDLTVGAPITCALRLTPDEQPGSTPLRIPASALELTVYVEAPSFYLEGEHIHTLPVIEGRPVEHSLSLDLIPLISGEQRIHMLVYPGQRLEGLQPAELTQVMQVVPPVALPDIPELIDRRAIPDPQPNVMLYVALEEAPDGQQVRLHLTCPALGLDREPLDPLPFTEQNLVGLRQAAVQTAVEVVNTSSPDALASLRAFGRGVFDRLMPPGHPLREWYWHVFALAAHSDTPWAWLVVSDERAMLPWELVCPYMLRPDTAELWHDEFLGRKFVLAHWVGRQGLTLAGEAPLGLLDLTHYQQHPQEIVSRWRAVLGGEEQVGVEDETGHLALMQADSRYYGLHILRYSDRHQLGRITALDGQEAKSATNRSEAETMIFDRRLDFTLRRPVVGLSFVDEQPVSLDMGLRGRDTRLEAGWMLPLMHAGATALVGARWPVSPEADQLFFRVFYQTIRNGIPLGWAVWEAREQVRLAFPHRPDWLAYAYFGHPWCQPYRVRPAQGFTLFEAIKHPKGEPFLAGETYQFRASYRAEPPAWYDGRLKYRRAPQQEQEEDTSVLEKTDDAERPEKGEMVPRQEEDMSVLVMPLTGVMPETFQLEPIPAGDGYQCKVMLTMPDTETTWPVLVRFQKGEQELRTLVLNFDVVEKV